MSQHFHAFPTADTNSNGNGSSRRRHQHNAVNTQHQYNARPAALARTEEDLQGLGAAHAYAATRPLETNEGEHVAFLGPITALDRFQSTQENINAPPFPYAILQRSRQPDGKSAEGPRVLTRQNSCQTAGRTQSVHDNPYAIPPDEYRRIGRDLRERYKYPMALRMSNGEDDFFGHGERSEPNAVRVSDYVLGYNLVDWWSYETAVAMAAGEIDVLESNHSSSQVVMTPSSTAESYRSPRGSEYGNSQPDSTNGRRHAVLPLPPQSSTASRRRRSSTASHDRPRLPCPKPGCPHTSPPHRRQDLERHIWTHGDHELQCNRCDRRESRDDHMLEHTRDKCVYKPHRDWRIVRKKGR